MTSQCVIKPLRKVCLGRIYPGCGKPETHAKYPTLLMIITLRRKVVPKGLFDEIKSQEYIGRGNPDKPGFMSS